VTKLPTDADLAGLLNVYTGLMEKVPILYLRITSGLAAISERVEAAVGLLPMPEVTEKRRRKTSSERKTTNQTGPCRIRKSLSSKTQGQRKLSKHGSFHVKR
jgi:hypothetical protein